MIAPEMPYQPGTFATSTIVIVPVQEAFSLFTRRSSPTDHPRIQAKLRELNEAMAESIDDGALFTEIGNQFHDEMVRGCGNHTMIAVVGSLETLWTSHLQQWADKTAARGEYPSMSK